ncbi:MAG: glutamate 5-kinase [Ruminococcus sp.]|nr:glutamate 5-kinase [Ruminococcus sp.]
MSSISDKKRIVIKLGSSTLTHKTGRLNLRKMDNLIKVIADLHNSGKEIIMVSSGSIALGVGKLGFKERPTDTPSKQACASVGQCELMYMYDKLFDNYGITVSQILLTKATIENERQKNVENTFKRLLELNVIPIVNENDTVAIDELELEIGENDSLSALVAKFCGADLLVILSDIDGLYSSDPHKSDNARLIPVVTEISAYIENIAGGAGSSLGTGGMATKINAGKIATENGIDMVIMNGDNPNNLYDLFDDKPVGTLFLAKTDTINSIQS